MRSEHRVICASAWRGLGIGYRGPFPEFASLPDGPWACIASNPWFVNERGNSGFASRRCRRSSCRQLSHRGSTPLPALPLGMTLQEVERSYSLHKARCLYDACLVTAVPTERLKTRSATAERKVALVPPYLRCGRFTR
jgi:hypothetical protein